jgi:hypothetical protein
MAIGIDKEMRARAKRDDKYLFQVSLDSKYLSEETKAKFRGKAPTQFKFDIAGPLAPKQAVELWQLISKWRKADLV